ncbi:MAG TPA: hypothetical protein VF271_00620 [Rhodanobacteraceae bacterium]
MFPSEVRLSRTRPEQGRTPFDVRRSLACAVVLGLHAALWLAWSLPPATRPRVLHTPRRHVAKMVAVDLIPPPTTPTPLPVVRSFKRAKTRHARRNVRHAHRDITKAVAKPAVAASAPMPRRPLRLNLPKGFAAAPAWHTGRTLQAPHHAAPRVPGHDPVYGMPVFTMADPRYSGIAGGIRILQGLLGAADPHCVDVDTWRAMTPAQLHQHHQTRYTVEAIAHQHGCRPPKAVNKAAASAYWH